MSGSFGGQNGDNLLQQIGAPKRRKKTPEEKAAAARAYYMANRERLLETARRYREEHPDRVKASRLKHKAKRDMETGHISLGWHGFAELPVEQRRAYAKKFSADRRRYMYFAEYQVIARRTQNPALTKDERREHALCGLMSEVGEIAAVFQKKHQGHPVRTSEVALEIGDLLWFVAELCDVLGYDMDTVAKWNVDKLRERYPNGFDAQRSLHREE